MKSCQLDKLLTVCQNDNQIDDIKHHQFVRAVRQNLELIGAALILYQTAGKFDLTLNQLREK